jgi:hypothetical protein
MRIKVWVAGLLLIAGAYAAALASSGGGGGGAPEEVHWTLTGQTSVTINWRAGESAVRYGPTKSMGQTLPAVAPVPEPFSAKGPYREARITGLKENTLYYYSVGGKPATFRTPPPRGTSGFVFHVQGDIGNASDWDRMGVIQEMIADGKPRFVLCVGDLTYGNSVGQQGVRAHFNDVMKWSLDAAYMPAWGNHEWDEPEDDDLRNYKGRFDLPNPQSSPVDPRHPHTGGGEDWYWFDYGNVRFVAYPEPWDGAWEDWVERVKPVMQQAQDDPAISFIVTFGHRPAFSSGYHEGEPELQGILGTLRARFDKYVLNFCGHSHNYERSYHQRGLVHITAGTGGSNLEETSNRSCLWHGGCPPPSWSAFRAMHHAVVEVRVMADRIFGTVYCGPAGDQRDNENDMTCLRGSVIDSFAIYPGGHEPGTIKYPESHGHDEPKH